MGAKDRPATATPRRREVLAIIVDRIARSGICPTYEQIGDAMVPTIGKTRVRQLVAQLVERGIIAREPGSQRGIYVRDLAGCRDVVLRVLENGGPPARTLVEIAPPIPCTSEQLPRFPSFEHLHHVD